MHATYSDVHVQIILCSIRPCASYVMNSYYKLLHSLPLFILTVRKCNVEYCSECIARSDSICQTCFPDYELSDGRCKEIPVTMATSSEAPAVTTDKEDDSNNGLGLSSDEIAGNL